MPLLNKKPFEPTPIPVELNDNDRVYYLEASNEIFISYDDYFERQIQLTSTIWSCEYTGKSGLTFFEALESEKNAIKTIGSFPSYLEVPILFIVHKYTCRGRFDELLNDIFFLMKDRYFIGEECFYTESGKRRNARIVACSVETQYNGNHKEKSDTSNLPSPSCYNYNLEILDDMGSGDDGMREDVTFESLSRGKQAAPRSKLKLFLKNCCYLETRRYTVKTRYLDDGVIRDHKWSSILGGPEPSFPQTPMMAKGRPSKVNGVEKQEIEENMATPETGKGRRKSEKGRVMSEKKRQKIITQQEELTQLFEAAKRLNVDVTKYQQNEKLLSTAEIATLKESLKATRIEEREAQREVKKQKVKAKHEWTRKRDDLDCDDLKPLPASVQQLLPDSRLRPGLPVILPECLPASAAVCSTVYARLFQLLHPATATAHRCRRPTRPAVPAAMFQLLQPAVFDP